MRISDWSSDVCSSDLPADRLKFFLAEAARCGSRRAQAHAGRDRRRLAVEWYGVLVCRKAAALKGLDSNVTSNIEWSKIRQKQMTVRSSGYQSQPASRKCIAKQTGRESCRERVCQYV